MESEGGILEVEVRNKIRTRNIDERITEKRNNNLKLMIQDDRIRKKNTISHSANT